MQILVLHCASLTSTNVAPCDGADVLPDEEIGEPFSFGDCLYALVTVESGDRAGACWKAAKGIRTISEHAQTKHVVINGFAHLSPKTAELSATRPILDRLVTHLDESVGLDVTVLPLAWRKRWLLDVLDHEWAQRSIHV